MAFKATMRHTLAVTLAVFALTLLSCHSVDVSSGKHTAQSFSASSALVLPVDALGGAFPPRQPVPAQRWRAQRPGIAFTVFAMVSTASSNIAGVTLYAAR